jgi:hypothetical protein
MTRLGNIPAELLVMAKLGLILGLLGPFGTFAMPIASRIGLWLLFAIGGYACYRPVIAAGRMLADRASLPLVMAMVIACLIASLPVTVMVTLPFHHTLDPDALAHQYPYVLLVGGMATAIQFLLFTRRAATPAGAAPAPVIESSGIASVPVLPSETPVSPSPFLDRLPPHLGRDLLCLEMEDHYVRAHTLLGSTLLLMRMRDATGELTGIAGERVHRSWWVAHKAVAESGQRDRATFLRLTNGLEVPVARSSVPLLRSQGWL